MADRAEAEVARTAGQKAVDGAKRGVDALKDALKSRGAKGESASGKKGSGAKGKKAPAKKGGKGGKGGGSGGGGGG